MAHEKPDFSCCIRPARFRDADFSSRWIPGEYGVVGSNPCRRQIGGDAAACIVSACYFDICVIAACKTCQQIFAACLSGLKRDETC